jgi:outer membrane protein assembly factor BamB
LLALEPASHTLLWRRPASTAVRPVVAAGVVYAGSTGYEILARQPGDGSELWQSEPAILTLGPAVAGGTVFVAVATTVYALRA